MQRIIDCHTHFLCKEDFDLYKKSAVANKYINIRGLNIAEMLSPFKFDDFKDVEDMFFLDSADLENVDESIKLIKDDINHYSKILGIKIYLGYQKFYASDKRVEKIVDFAAANNLAITFHCGEILDENDKSVYSPYSDAKYIKELAIRYPDTTFVASHLNWPNFDELFCLCNDFDNIYTCLSGTNDGGTQRERDGQNHYIASIINEFIVKYPKIKRKIMYGTDFFATSDEYNNVSSYKTLVDMLDLTEEEKEDVLCNNAMRAYKL